MITRYAGFDAVTLANNHINDFGDATVNLTVRTLDSHGIGHFGINYGNQPYASQVRNTGVNVLSSIKAPQAPPRARSRQRVPASSLASGHPHTSCTLKVLITLSYSFDL